jgi:signal transduction histidine kinase
MFSEMLQRKYKGRLDPEADAFIGYSVQGVKRMDELINNLLAYARASQTGDSSTEPVDLNKVREKVLDHLKTAVEEAHATVQSEPLPNLYIEESRLQQLFQNLIGNAIKYRRPDAAPHIRISAIKRGDEWTFSVADNGMGIDPAYRAKVFDSFQRLHQTSSPGTGLGLAICRKIVENLGGKIWVDSEPGKGSIFQFTIPARFSCSA